MINGWRLYALIVILILGVIDLSLTSYYVYKYKNWQPDKPYKLIERNPLLVLLWNSFGFAIGMIVGSVVILSLQYLVVKDGWWWIILILFIALVYTMFNHHNNISLLNKLIDKYPTGHLSEEVIGKV